MRRIGSTFTALAAVAVLAGSAGAADAQQGDGWWDWALPALTEARGGSAQAAHRGPPFCRNGQGHPVHGRQWCRDKGWGVGGGVFDTRWDDRRWEDVILRAPRGADRRRGVLDRGGLIDVLGDVVYGRLAAEGSRLGATGPLTGRWLRADGAAAILQIRSGRHPVAELTDLNGNGWVDAVLIAGR